MANELLEHRVSELEKKMDGLGNRFAIKLTERIVFTLCGAILMGFVTSAVAGVNIASLFGG